MNAPPPAGRRGPTRLLYVAAAGYGKTAAMEADLRGDSCRRAADLVGASARSLDCAADQVSVDDLGELGTAAQEDVMRLLAGLKPQVQLSIASRSPLPRSVRRLLSGPVFERGPSDLALSPESIAVVLREEHGVEDISLSTTVHALTTGWPALVQFACDALARGDARTLRSALSEPGTASATWMEDEVLAALPEHVLGAVAATADLDVLTPDLFAMLTNDDTRDARSDAFAHLRRVGLLVPHPSRHPSTESFRLVPVVADVVASLGLGAGPAAADGRRLIGAAGWYASNGHPLASARTLVRAGLDAEASSLVQEHGEEMLAAGEAAGIVEVLGAGEARSAACQRLLADALRMSGDASAASRAFAPLVARAEATGDWPAGLVWRAAMVHYMLADYHAALSVLDRAAVREGLPERDDVELLACRAQVLAALGNEEEASSVADSSVRAAEKNGDARAAAAAQLAAANASRGTTRDGHLAQALRAARASGDVVLTARALLNQSHWLLAAALYRQAREAAAEAVRMAELGSPPGLLVVALHNLGESERRLGDYVEAELHLHRSIALCRDLGLRRAASGLWSLAEIHREFGRQEQSLVSYDAAVEAARASDEVQVLVPALSGLAHLLTRSAEQTERARAAVDEAERRACPKVASYSLVAAGWVALAEGNREAAERKAADALSAARSSGTIDALAQALELTAVVAVDPKAAHAALQEALAIWDVGGAEPAADRVRVLLGQLSCVDGSVRSEAREAGRRLLRRGIHAVNGLPLASAAGSSTVEVRLLGGFEVRVGGRSVPVPAWRSKQARTLVKILASRRGRFMTRSEVCELLWPDDDPARTGHRLSVVLSAVRAVLDPDRVWPADHFVAADLSGLRLDVTHVGVDVEQLLQDAAYATDLLRAGDFGRADEILSQVVETYQGDALEDEPYAAWADGLREEARAALLRSVRNLAELRRRSGDHHEAAALLVRLLSADPYDEPAHRGLVRVLVQGGRHGEARRAFARWAEAMRSIDAPAPDARVLETARPHAPGGSARVAGSVA